MGSRAKTIAVLNELNAWSIQKHCPSADLLFISHSRESGNMASPVPGRGLAIRLRGDCRYTGVHGGVGLSALFRRGEPVQKGTLRFIVEEDCKDPESQHLISSRSPSTFSSRPIDPRLVPRFHRDHAERSMDRVG